MMPTNATQSTLEKCRPPVVRGLLVVSLVCLMSVTLADVASAQGHPLYRGDMPPGMIGQLQTLRMGRAGYYQPVEVRGPQGSLVSLAVDCQFMPAEGNIAAAGMLLGEVYRVRIGNIPGLEGVEVFPSVEVIDRLCPPPGQATRFPIPVEISQEDLELAAAGKYVTRIVYVEDPRNPLPVRDVPGEQRVYEARANEDPLRVADDIGRPVAIVRMGSRTPDIDPTSGRFMFNCPSLMLYQRPPAEAPRNTGLEAPLEGDPVMGQATRNFRRLPPGVQMR